MQPGIKKFKKKMSKVRVVSKRGRKYANKVVNNMDDYFEEDLRQAKKLKPKI